MWNRTPVGRIKMRPPYGVNGSVTIGWVVRVPMPIPDQSEISARWCEVDGGPVPLRCWWSHPESAPGGQADAARFCDDLGAKPVRERAVLVLPEVFGVNTWVRSVADRFASMGVPALAMPLFARTAPELDLSYGEMQLLRGREHKNATTSAEILADLQAAIAWLGHALEASDLEITVVGFCFGGHASWLAATLPEVSRSFAFYGAGVVQGRPGGGAPSLELLPQVQGELTCLFGLEDPLIPASDRAAIEAALRAADPDGRRLRAVSYADADHGFMCEARAAFHDKAASAGWRLLKDAFRVG